MPSSIRVRFPPSPTGDLHIGGLRVALFNWLFARKQGGRFILRVEDTDQARYKPESMKSILEGLTWTGIDWDEGPQLDGTEKGERGPYIQSQRKEIYQHHASLLLNKGMVYRCFCTPERLEQMRQEQELRRQPPMYDKHCLKFSNQDIELKLKKGIPYVLRLKIPEKGRIEIEDLIHGKVAFDLSLVDDQVLLKSDGYPTYHLANVVDDHLMGITHVLRGEDWLSSLPKHVLLYEACGWEKPQFGHLPLILAPDKTKLSKRHGAVSILALRDLGYLPDALLNFTLLLGWNPGKGSIQEIFSKEEMIKGFSLAGIQKSPAIFNYEKLKWMNSEYIKKMPVAKLADLIIPHLLEAGLLIPLEAGEWVTADGKKISRGYIEAVAAIAQPRLIFPQGVIQEAEYFFNTPQYDASLLQWKNTGLASAHKHLLALQEAYSDIVKENDFTVNALEKNIKQWITEKGYNTGEVLWPLRVALTGRDKSPSPFEVIAVLGKDETLKRIDTAIEKLQNV